MKNALSPTIHYIHTFFLLDNSHSPHSFFFIETNEVVLPRNITNICTDDRYHRSQNSTISPSNEGLKYSKLLLPFTSLLTPLDLHSLIIVVSPSNAFQLQWRMVRSQVELMRKWIPNELHITEILVFPFFIGKDKNSLQDANYFGRLTSKETL